jgi:peptidoglycan hydrolase CwlO-like protein
MKKYLSILRTTLFSTLFLCTVMSLGSPAFADDTSEMEQVKKEIADLQTEIKKVEAARASAQKDLKKNEAQMSTLQKKADKLQKKIDKTKP